MPECATLDANVLVYSLDERFPDKQAAALDLIQGLQRLPRLLVTITLGEFFWAAARKGFLSASLAKDRVRDLTVLFPVVTYGMDHVLHAADAVNNRQLSFWDAVMLSAAEEAGCTVCFSEEMKDGTRLGNITVRNPFARHGLSRAARDVLDLK